MATNSNYVFDLEEIESYVKYHEIHEHMKKCLVQLCVRRPQNPYAFISEFFEKLSKVRYENTFEQTYAKP